MEVLTGFHVHDLSDSAFESIRAETSNRLSGLSIHIEDHGIQTWEDYGIIDYCNHSFSSALLRQVLLVMHVL